MNARSPLGTTGRGVVIKLQASDSIKWANRHLAKLANLRQIMAYLRATAILLAMLVFLCLTPLQWIALRRRWPLRRWFPVAFGRTLAHLLRLNVCAECAAPPQRSRLPGPHLIAANHVSWLDILAFYSVEPVCFLAKREIAAWPLISTFAPAGDRFRRSSAAAHDPPHQRGDGAKNALGPPHAALSGGHDGGRRRASQIS